MSATALPESGAETVEDDISLPFSLYFAALNSPHWSTYDQGDEKARREAESKRNVEKQRRMAQVTRLHDKLYHLKKSLSSVVDLDRNGLTEAAAEHMERSTQQFADEAKQLVAAMRADAATWRANELRAMGQLEEDTDEDDDMVDEHPDHDQDDDLSDNAFVPAKDYGLPAMSGVVPPFVPTVDRAHSHLVAAVKSSAQTQADAAQRVIAAQAALNRSRALHAEVIEKSTQRVAEAQQRLAEVKSMPTPAEIAQNIKAAR